MTGVDLKSTKFSNNKQITGGKMGHINMDQKSYTLIYEFDVRYFILRIIIVMTKPDILTIGIPTYNRKEAILSCLDHLYEKIIHLKARILVIDNASEDQSYQIIHKKYSHVFDIYKNKYNIGFAGNSIELFKNQFFVNSKLDFAENLYSEQLKKDPDKKLSS